MFIRIITILSLSFLPLVLFAQINLDATIGSGLSYADAKNTEKYLPILRPNAGLSVAVPVIKNIALQTGVQYTLRGYNTVQKETFGKDKSYYLTMFRMHYISIPLMLSVKAYSDDKLQAWIDGGINYNFFLAGNMRFNYKNYKNNELVDEKGKTYIVKGWFTPSKYSPTMNSYDVNALDIALKLQLRFLYKERYSFLIFHESSLYDIRANPDNKASTVKMQYSGIALGYRLF